jgi:hypothetical protein
MRAEFLVRSPGTRPALVRGNARPAQGSGPDERSARCFAPAVRQVVVDVEEVEDAADGVVDEVVDRLGLDVEGRDRGR